MLLFTHRCDTLYSPLTNVSVSDEKFLSSHTPVIYLLLSSPPLLPQLSLHSRRARPIEDLPSEEAARVST